MNRTSHKYFVAALVAAILTVRPPAGSAQTTPSRNAPEVDPAIAEKTQAFEGSWIIEWKDPAKESTFTYVTLRKRTDTSLVIEGIRIVDNSKMLPGASAGSSTTGEVSPSGELTLRWSAAIGWWGRGSRLRMSSDRNSVEGEWNQGIHTGAEIWRRVTFKRRGLRASVDAPPDPNAVLETRPDLPLRFDLGNRLAGRKIYVDVFGENVWAGASTLGREPGAGISQSIRVICSDGTTSGRWEYCYARPNTSVVGVRLELVTWRTAKGGRYVLNAGLTEIPVFLHADDAAAPAVRFFEPGPAGLIQVQAVSGNVVFVEAQYKSPQDGATREMTADFTFWRTPRKILLRRVDERIYRSDAIPIENE